MKKWIMIAAAAALFFVSGMVVADTINGDYKGNPIVKVTLQGKEIPAQDVPAQILDGRTVVPLYYLQSLGYDLTWNQQQYSVDIKPTQQASNRHKLTGEEIAQLKDRVGLLLAYNDGGVPFAQGSGFVVMKDGSPYLISAHHALIGSSKMVYENSGTSTFTKPDFDNSSADIFGVNLNKLTGNEGKTFPYLSYSTALPVPGNKVYAIGFPGGSIALTDGYVTKTFSSNGITFIQHSAPTDHGSSGGVLLNEYGEAIGITTDGGTLDGIAVPMMYVQQEIDKLKK